jgi:uncharacterized protein YecT (DUF1311 family)
VSDNPQSNKRAAPPRKVVWLAGGGVVAAVGGLAIAFALTRPAPGGMDGETPDGPQMRIVTQPGKPQPLQTFDVEPEAESVLVTPPPGQPIPRDPSLAAANADTDAGTGADAYVEAAPPPVERPEPRVARPSFDCNSSRGSRAEAMVCEDAALAAADRRLDRAYRRALATTDDVDWVQRQQRNWLADRESAADDGPDALAEAYDRRLDELSTDN